MNDCLVSTGDDVEYSPGVGLCIIYIFLIFTNISQAQKQLLERAIICWQTPHLEVVKAPLSASKPKGLGIGSGAGSGGERSGGERLPLCSSLNKTEGDDEEEELGFVCKTNHLHTLPPSSPRKPGLDQAGCLGTRSFLLLYQLTSVSQHLFP